MSLKTKEHDGDSHQQLFPYQCNGVQFCMSRVRTAKTSHCFTTAKTYDDSQNLARRASSRPHIGSRKRDGKETPAGIQTKACRKTGVQRLGSRAGLWRVMRRGDILLPKLIHPSNRLRNTRTAKIGRAV